MMLKRSPLLPIACVLMTCAGCASEHVVFVTKTSLSILEVDSKPPIVSVAYDRTEGYFGPSSENGEAPSVLGYFGSDGDIFNPNGRQLYATGNAARAALGAETICQPLGIQQSTDRTERLMFFGTSTTLGLKVGFLTTTSVPVPDSLVFGWRRKEFSVVPLLTAQTDVDYESRPPGCNPPSKPGRRFYPATFASINAGFNLNSSFGEKQNPVGRTIHQYFATGDAAVALAGTAKTQGLIQLLNENVFGEYYARVQAQNEVSLNVLECYSRTRVSDRPAIWTDGDRLGLYQNKDDSVKDPDANQDVFAVIKKWYAKYQANGDQNLLARADYVYAKSIGVPAGSDSARARLLEAHKVKVCELAKANQ